MAGLKEGVKMSWGREGGRFDYTCGNSQFGPPASFWLSIFPVQKYFNLIDLTNLCHLASIIDQFIVFGVGTKFRTCLRINSWAWVKGKEEELVTR